MPSTRPFISFLFGSLSSTPASNSPPPRRGLNAPKPLRQSSHSSATAAQPTAIPPAAVPLHSRKSHQMLGKQASATSPPSDFRSTSPGSLASSPPSIAASYNERRNSSGSLSGSDKWWIGGKLADGTDRYYRLQPLSSHKSFDRVSFDRLSI